MSDKSATMVDWPLLLKEKKEDININDSTVTDWPSLIAQKEEKKGNIHCWLRCQEELDEMNVKCQEEGKNLKMIEEKRGKEQLLLNGIKDQMEEKNNELRDKIKSLESQIVANIVKFEAQQEGRITNLVMMENILNEKKEAVRKLKEKRDEIQGKCLKEHNVINRYKKFSQYKIIGHDHNMEGPQNTRDRELIRRYSDVRAPKETQIWLKSNFDSSIAFPCDICIRIKAERSIFDAVWYTLELFPSDEEMMLVQKYTELFQNCINIKDIIERINGPINNGMTKIIEKLKDVNSDVQLLRLCNSCMKECEIVCQQRSEYLILKFNKAWISKFFSFYTIGKLKIENYTSSDAFFALNSYLELCKNDKCEKCNNREASKRIGHYYHVPTTKFLCKFCYQHLGDTGANGNYFINDNETNWTRWFFNRIQLLYWKESLSYEENLRNALQSVAASLTSMKDKTESQKNVATTRIEDIVADELLNHFEITSKKLTRNRVVKKKVGCLKRPDFFGYIGQRQFIIIEIDEYQHRDYDPFEEKKRMYELYKVVKNELQERFLIIIRFNPHEFDEINSSGEKRKRSTTTTVPFDQRMSYLKRILTEIHAMSHDVYHIWRKQFERNGIYALYLYYNGSSLEESSMQNLRFDYFPFSDQDNTLSLSLLAKFKKEEIV